MRTVYVLLFWLLPTLAFGASKRVAVLPLENPGQLSDQEISFLTDLVRGITTDRLPVARFTVMTDENLQAMLPPGTTLADCIGECVVETGRNLKAHYVVTGRVYNLESSRRLSIRVHVTRTGAMLKQIQLKGPNIESLEDALQTGSAPLFEVIRRHAAGGLASLGRPEADTKSPAPPPRAARQDSPPFIAWPGCLENEMGLSMLGMCWLGNFYGLAHVGYLFWAHVDGNMHGFYQLGLLTAEAGGNVRGFCQISMVHARTDGNFSGFGQVSALNHVGGRLYGAQFGLYNYAREVRGLQFGAVNNTEQLRGLQIGLLNLSRDGGMPFFLGLNIGW